MNLLVMDMETPRGNLLTTFDDYDVIDVAWVGDDRAAVLAGPRLTSPTGAGQLTAAVLFVVGRDGSGARLAPTVRETGSATRYIIAACRCTAMIPGNTDRVIAEATRRPADSVDLYRLNLNTGRTWHPSCSPRADRPG